MGQSQKPEPFGHGIINLVHNCGIDTAPTLTEEKLYFTRQRHW